MVPSLSLGHYFVFVQWFNSVALWQTEWLSFSNVHNSLVRHWYPTFLSCDYMTFFCQKKPCYLPAGFLNYYFSLGQPFAAFGWSVQVRTSTALWRWPGARCEYRFVIARVLCPKSLDTVVMSTPFITRWLANVWRRSWKWKSMSPAARQAVEKERFTSW